MTHDNGQLSIPCAFCHGKGTDPYNQLSSLSRCEVCKGRKTVNVPHLHERCNFCKGTGSYKTFCCMVCRGKGVVEVLPGPVEVCSECDGLAYEVSSGLPCLKCRGRGWVAASRKETGVAS